MGLTEFRLNVWEKEVGKGGMFGAYLTHDRSRASLYNHRRRATLEAAVEERQVSSALRLCLPVAHPVAQARDPDQAGEDRRSAGARAPVQPAAGNGLRHGLPQPLHDRLHPRPRGRAAQYQGIRLSSAEPEGSEEGKSDRPEASRSSAAGRAAFRLPGSSASKAIPWISTKHRERSAASSRCASPASACPRRSWTRNFRALPRSA